MSVFLGQCVPFKKQDHIARRVEDALCNSQNGVIEGNGVLDCNQKISDSVILLTCQMAVFVIL